MIQHWHDSNISKPYGVLYLPYRYAELAWWTRKLSQLLGTLTSSIHALNSRVSKQPEMGSVVTDRGTTWRTCRFHHSNLGRCCTKEINYFIFQLYYFSLSSLYLLKKKPAHFCGGFPIIAAHLILSAWLRKGDETEFYFRWEHKHQFSLVRCFCQWRSYKSKIKQK